MTVPGTQPDDRIWRRTRRLLTALTVLILLIGLAAPTAIFIWRAHTPTIAVEQGPAGALRIADVHTSFYVTGSVMHLTTSEGTLVAHGAFTAPIGTMLIAERTNKASGMRVCTTDAPRACARLIGTWAGPMQPPPNAGKVVNFVQHGWTEGDLEGWLGIGFTVTCLMALAWVLALLIRDRLTDDCDDGNNNEGDDDCRGTPSVRS